MKVDVNSRTSQLRPPIGPVRVVSTDMGLPLMLTVYIKKYCIKVDQEKVVGPVTEVVLLLRWSCY